MSERVIDGKTGYVAEDETSFSRCACDLLLNDDLWIAHSKAALNTQRRWGWAEAADEFERLIPKN